MTTPNEPDLSNLVGEVMDTNTKLFAYIRQMMEHAVVMRNTLQIQADRCNSMIDFLAETAQRISENSADALNLEFGIFDQMKSYGDEIEEEVEYDDSDTED